MTLTRARDIFDGASGRRPFSFDYWGAPVAALLHEWKVGHTTRELANARTEHVITHFDPSSGLEVACVGVEYADYPVVEWTVFLRNRSRTKTPVIENFRGIDLDFALGTGEVMLHYNRGSHGLAERDDFRPLMEPLAHGTPKRLGVSGGRPSEDYLPYFNLSAADAGVIVAVGWPGQWSAELTRTERGEVRVAAGQELTRFRLGPGEEARSPLIALLFHDGHPAVSQNVWRRWMIEHNLPRMRGRLPAPRFSGLTYLAYWGLSTQSDELAFMNRYLSAGIHPDAWWIDAGWYTCDGRWSNTGSWFVDTDRHPGGLGAVSDHAHANGMRTMLWFEPERVTPGTWLATRHPEWLLGDPAGDRLLDLGNPHAREWLVNHVDWIMETNGVDDYRQDFNMSPIEAWRANDADDRQGLSENFHVAGYLAFWDELRSRRPDMLIDTCASGGRRLDLETLRRAVPLWRSDYRSEPVGTQGQTFGISSWIPYSGVAAEHVDPYTFRSNMTLSIDAAYDVREDGLDLALLRDLVEQWRLIAANYLGDYYPLTDYSLADCDWMAWQFHRPEAGAGLVQAFRRPDCPETLHVALQGLDPELTYTLVDADRCASGKATGRELMRKGLTLTTPSAPGAVLLTYGSRGRGAA